MHYQHNLVVCTPILVMYKSPPDRYNCALAIVSSVPKFYSNSYVINSDRSMALCIDSNRDSKVLNLYHLSKFEAENRYLNLEIELLGTIHI